MDPKTQECLGLYLYGAGYYARDDNTLSMVTARTGKRETPPHFCLSCRKREECEAEHEERVRAAAPEAAGRFDELMGQARSRGVPPTLAAVHLATRGLDPYAKVAVDNFSRGHGDRGRKSGTLVQ